jgi:hypothetical protein
MKTQPEGYTSITLILVVLRLRSTNILKLASSQKHTPDIFRYS